MKTDAFNAVIEEQLRYCKALLVSKGAEYTPEYLDEVDGEFIVSQSDRLRHFKKAAVLMNMTPKAALLGMLSKHLISVVDMCTDGNTYSVERWTEKLTDSINYLLILKAIVIEEQTDEKN